MASETESPVSRTMDFPLFLSLILGINNPNPDQDPSTGRFVVINPLTRSMIVIESGSDTSSSSLNFESLLRELSSKQGQPPASKASIEALKSVEICEDEMRECAVCLEELKVAKEMPCQHRFHKDCIEKWLKIHGSCPVCRFVMPAEDDDDDEVKNKSESRLRGTGILVGFGFGDLSDLDNGQSVSNESDS